MSDTATDIMPQMNMRSNLNLFSKLNHPPINSSGVGFINAGFEIGLSLYSQYPKANNEMTKTMKIAKAKSIFKLFFGIRMINIGERRIAKINMLE